MPNNQTLRLSFVVAAIILSAAVAPAAEPSPLTPAVVKADFDAAAFREWVDGVERPLTAGTGPANVVWTRDGKPANREPDWRGVAFGEGKKPGPRHLRIGFTTAKTIGTAVTAGNGRVSTLKASATYPGDLSDESQWVPAERIEGSRPTTEAADGRIAVWTLPANTSTRAIRVSHDAPATAKSYAGGLDGLVLFAERLANVAPLATPAASANDHRAGMLVNGTVDRWDCWDSTLEKGEAPLLIDTPAWVMLTWERPVVLRGLGTIWSGFGAAEAQAYTGPADRHPREAKDSDWKTVFTGDKLDPLYPYTLGPQWLPFNTAVTTKAVRLKLTKPAPEGHPHLKGRTKDGRRAWLGELLAFASVGDGTLAAALPPVPNTDGPPPPIPVRFTLKVAGYVTLVIEDAEGKRVRNLISEAWFPAGDNEARWDGLDDLGRDADAAKHGVYSAPGKPVAPGTYRVRGLWGPRIDLKYEFPVYTAGNPAWQTADATGGWLSNHSPPMATQFVPAKRGPDGKATVYLGSYVSEGTHGLAWVDSDGRKLGGVNWVGGNWTGAPFLARDDGQKAVAGVYVYVGSVWETDKQSGVPEARFTAMTAAGERVVAKHRYEPGKGPMNARGRLDAQTEVGGLAARDGRLYMSLTRANRLLVVDAQGGGEKREKGKDAPQPEVKSVTVADPRGLAFDGDGKLLVISGTKLLRFRVEPLDADDAKPATETVIADGLEDPHGIAVDAAGNIYVSDHGRSHQVKVFSPKGKLLRTVGKPGGPQLGAYDPEKMHHPFGITIDDQDRLWVAERDEQPKKVSVWDREGKLVKSFYGPMEYGGGGVLDPRDPTRFYYLGMEFALDWKAGTSTLKTIFHRHGHDGGEGLPFRSGPPVVPLERDGQRYFTNAYHSSPTGGHGTAAIWRLDDKGIAVLAAIAGRADQWDALKEPAFASLWPPAAKGKAPNPATFVWTDRNGDGKPQPDEVVILPGSPGGVTVMPDLSFVFTRFGDRTVRLAPTGFTAAKVPLYDLARAEVLAEGVEGPKSSGGDQALAHPDGWTVLTLGVKPFAAHSVTGVFKGKTMWSYPNLWPGLHASHTAPVADHPGELIGTTRLLGGFVTPKEGDAGPLWIVNGNMGAMYLFTADGMFVRTLFHDFRTGRPWSMPASERGMVLNDVTSGGENFWPSVTQTEDGRVFLADGARGSLVRVEHLEKLRRLPTQTLTIAEKDLVACAAWQADRELARQARQGSGTLKVSIRPTAPTVDGKLDDWAGADWATIDRRGVKAWFNADSRPYDAAAALAVSGDRLYAAFRCGEKDLLKNAGTAPTAPFKTGGALDLMLATDPSADPKRTSPAAGDLRLLITLVPDPGKKKDAVRPLALLYRPVVPGSTEKDRAPFSSPWRTVTFDRVEDVTAKVMFAASAEGDYEISVPLDVIGLKPEAGAKLRGDVGLLRGNGFETTQRVYWANKATGIVNDVPSEAALTPHLWGTLEFLRGK
jgi:hypothetical protein